MAAPQWTGGKIKSLTEAKAKMRHSTKKERTYDNHSNPHINKALTKDNFSYRNLTYKQRCDAFDKRLGEIDVGRQTTGKNARVVLQSIVVWAPEALRGDLPRLRDWFRRVGEIAEERFGASNVIDMAVDVDEVHEYTDPDTKEKRMSSEHGHLWVVPEVGGKLNGKQFYSLTRVNGFNKALDKMTRKEFGCPMMDGTGKKEGPDESVEALKLKSEIATLEVERDGLADEVQVLRKQRDEAQEGLSQVEADTEAAKARLEAVQAQEAQEKARIQEAITAARRRKEKAEEAARRIENKVSHAMEAAYNAGYDDGLADREKATSTPESMKALLKQVEEIDARETAKEDPFAEGAKAPLYPYDN